MKILIVGSGGREHALAWKVAMAPTVQQVFVAPGNAGTAGENKVTNVAINATDIASLAGFVKENNIDLTIVGPEAPLAAGITDAFTAAGLNCFGPNQQAAQLEASKVFAKDFCVRHHIPTAKSETFTDANSAKKYIAAVRAPVVIKADGLAAGKGVVVADDVVTANAAVAAMLQQNKFGAAGSKIIIEEKLIGREISYMIVTDGNNFLPLATSQDHKALYDNNAGPNTGGMGAFSPAPNFTAELEQKIIDTVIKPTLSGLRQDGINYCGFLYAGLMVNANDDIKVLEFNCRLGDPETQVILPRLQSDLAAVCYQAVTTGLQITQLQWQQQPALTVVLASEGYPEQYEVGKKITGCDSTNAVKVFHAATKKVDNNIVTTGGRVMAITAMAPQLAQCREKAYAAIENIDFAGKYYRSDIGNI